MTQHAACSPSSASMWMNCPASITKTKGMERPSSKYAREGTAAHKVAELILQGDVFLPDKITVEGDTFIVSRGMCEALNPYIDYIQKLAKPGAGAVLEYQVQVPDTFGMVWGTLDCGVLTAENDLHIIDLKYGKGVAVDPAGPQLKLYALGLISDFTQPVHSITLTICQPRVAGGPLRSCSMTPDELRSWFLIEVRPALKRIKDGDDTENTGSWCRWCVRQTQCRAFNSRHQGHAADAFTDLP